MVSKGSYRLPQNLYDFSRIMSSREVHWFSVERGVTVKSYLFQTMKDLRLEHICSRRRFPPLYSKVSSPVLQRFLPCTPRFPPLYSKVSSPLLQRFLPYTQRLPLLYSKVSFQYSKVSFPVLQGFLPYTPRFPPIYSKVSSPVLQGYLLCTPTFPPQKLQGFIPCTSRLLPCTPRFPPLYSKVSSPVLQGFLPCTPRFPALNYCTAFQNKQFRKFQKISILFKMSCIFSIYLHTFYSFILQKLHTRDPNDC